MKFRRPFTELKEGIDYYKTSEGYIVYTAKYHLDRGYCCQSGCRHCPYGFNKLTGKFDRPGKRSEDHLS